ncbi:hypothetical protein ACFVAF_25595 [Streptomyces sp. NPDC057596]
MTAPIPPDAEPTIWPVPDWVTDPNAGESIADGHIPVDPEFFGETR